MENLDVIAGVFVATDLNNGAMVHAGATRQRVQCAPLEGRRCGRQLRTAAEQFGLDSLKVLDRHGPHVISAASERCWSHLYGLELLCWFVWCPVARRRGRGTARTMRARLRDARASCPPAPPPPPPHAFYPAAHSSRN